MVPGIDPREIRAGYQPGSRVEGFVRIAITLLAAFDPSQEVKCRAG
jgi:hypothetical protein